MKREITFLIFVILSCEISVCKYSTELPTSLCMKRITKDLGLLLLKEHLANPGLVYFYYLAVKDFKKCV